MRFPVSSTPLTAFTHAEADSRIEPLADGRYSIELAATPELRDKIERAAHLLRHRYPGGDLEVLLDSALDALLKELGRLS